MFPIFAGANPSATGYNLTRSLRTRASASAYLNRTFATPTSTTKGTYSIWLKRGKLSANQELVGAGSSNYDQFQFTSSDTLRLVLGAAADGDISTAAVFRDPSSWYHIVLAIDTTQATASNRAIIYVNNAIQTVTTSTAVTLNATPRLLGAVAHFIGCYAGSTSTNNFDGYLAEVNFIDGQALTPSSFGSTNATTGVWQPARYTSSYGTNGFYLPFTDNSALTTSSNVGLGKDFSGNGNYWVTNNISITAGATYDSMTDVPTLTSATAANFCVLNPLDNGGITIADGNLTCNQTGADSMLRASFGVSSGKWYWEATLGNTKANVGIAKATAALSSYLGSDANGWGYYSVAGTKVNSGATTAYGATYTTGDVVGVAFDADAGTLTFYKNNVSQGVAFTGLTSGPYFPAQGTSTSLQYFNFGQRPFSYTPPTGYVALNTYNLPTSTIVKGNTVMDATLYTGNGSTQTITNAAAFKPDLVWIKGRSSSSQDHTLVDSVRGVSRRIRSNATTAEVLESGFTVTAFNSSGFTAVDDTNGGYNVNGSVGGSFSGAAQYVGWQWQAGQGSTSSNTNGSITSTVSVNASAGFSVVTYTGTAVAGTIGHGLGVAPQLIIIKPRSATITTDAWNVYHVSTGNTNFLVLNATDASAAASNRWNNTSPTSSVFSIGTVPSSVAVGYVAYCWTPIAGYSAFGSYTGNGSTSGPFVYCGFQPKFILIKSTTAARDWIIWDTARNTFNIGTAGVLYPDTSGAEYSGGGAYAVAVTSNGFYLPVTTTNLNASGETHIYAAFASNPFKNSLAF